MKKTEGKKRKRSLQGEEKSKKRREKKGLEKGNN